MTNHYLQKYVISIQAVWGGVNRHTRRGELKNITGLIAFIG